jgi:mannose/fructose/N-acetylgalactosamine-specific phosphotransferase system component IID
MEAGSSDPADKVHMILLQEVIHQIYFVMAGLIAVLLLTRLFRRKTRPGLAYDIVYAYAIIPFILRALHIK